jgi:hypothetical protein
MSSPTPEAARRSRTRLTCANAAAFSIRLKRLRQHRHELALAPESGDQREVDIDGFARLTPAQYGQPTDEAEAPPMGFADGLQVGRGANEGVHGSRSLANRRCCSINPDVGWALAGARDSRLVRTTTRSP